MTQLCRQFGRIRQSAFWSGVLIYAAGLASLLLMSPGCQQTTPRCWECGTEKITDVEWGYGNVEFTADASLEQTYEAARNAVGQMDSSLDEQVRENSSGRLVGTFGDKAVLVGLTNAGGSQTRVRIRVGAGRFAQIRGQP
mgnify:CR=1 FL=1